MPAQDVLVIGPVNGARVLQVDGQEIPRAADLTLLDTRGIVQNTPHVEAL